MTRNAVDITIERGQNTRILILEFIVQYMDVNGWSPSYTEIAEGVGLSSRSNVMLHLYQLQREGKLVLGGGPRMLRPVK